MHDALLGAKVSLTPGGLRLAGQVTDRLLAHRAKVRRVQAKRYAELEAAVKINRLIDLAVINAA